MDSGRDTPRFVAIGGACRKYVLHDSAEGFHWLFRHELKACSIRSQVALLVRGRRV